MRILIVVCLLSAQISEAYSRWVVEANYAILHALGFRPGEKIENATGFLTESCEYKGKSLSTTSKDLGKCLVFALLDYDETETLNPLQLTLTSVNSKRTFDVTLNWRPLKYHIDRQSWLRIFGIVRSSYRIAELKLLLEYNLMNDLDLIFSQPLEVQDLKFPGVEKYAKLFKNFKVEHLHISSHRNAEGRLSGVLEARSKSSKDMIFSLVFKTNWGLFSSDPMKAKLSGRLSYPPKILEQPQ